MAKYKVFENPANNHREKVKDGFKEAIRCTLYKNRV